MIVILNSMNRILKVNVENLHKKMKKDHDLCCWGTQKDRDGSSLQLSLLFLSGGSFVWARSLLVLSLSIYSLLILVIFIFWVIFVFCSTACASWSSSSSSFSTMYYVLCMYDDVSLLDWRCARCALDLIFSRNRRALQEILILKRADI